MADVKNVTASKPNVAGAIKRAPLGTTLPTDAVTALTGFTNLGYVSEDGYTNSNSMEVETVKAWGGAIVLTSETSKKDEFKIKLLESLNPEVLKTIYGESNVTGSDLATGIAVVADSTEQSAYVWVIEEILKDNVYARTVIPNGTITNIADIAHKDGDPIGYEVTITCLPDASLNGATHKTYYKKASN